MYSAMTTLLKIQYTSLRCACEDTRLTSNDKKSAQNGFTLRLIIKSKANPKMEPVTKMPAYGMNKVKREEMAYRVRQRL